MSDAMSSAELAEQVMELLPARIVLSLLHADTAVGIPGEPGIRGADGTSTPGTSMWAILTGYDHSNYSNS